MHKISDSKIKEVKNHLVSKIEEEGLKKFKTKIKFADSLGKSPGWLNNKLKKHRGIKIEDLILMAETLDLRPEDLFPKEKNEINVEPIIECVKTIAEHTVKKYIKNNKFNK